jgi:hypothetical protein
VFYSKAYESGHAEGHFIPLQTEKKSVYGERKTKNRKWTKKKGRFYVYAVKWAEFDLQSGVLSRTW